MLALSALSFLLFSQGALAHGGHDSSGPAAGETIQQYAQRHMSSEHHIDSFDIRSFFQLHDLNRDGFWDREEIEAVYGVHHVYSQKKSKDDIEHQNKADYIVKEVLIRLDLDKDGRVTAEELEKVGLDALPNFATMGAEGHHYDVESEFFLHHEEEFHSTPETQTDESYNHPEDLEHFAMHESIERKEAEKEAKFQGITVEEALKQHEYVEPPAPPKPPTQGGDIPAPADGSNPTPELAAQMPIIAHPHDEQIVPEPPLQEPPSPPKPKYTRVPPPEQQDPSIKFKSARTDAERKGEWGAGEGGYKPPSDPSDKMRKNLPYKYKFRRNWGDF